MDVSIDILPEISVSKIKHGDTCMSIENGSDTIYLHGNCAAFRRFFEACLMCVPFPLIGRVRGEDGTEVILDEEVGR